jgi:hypothetical protein
MRDGVDDLDYELAAIVGFEAVINSSDGRFLEVRSAALENGLALIPVTKELMLELAQDAEMSLNEKTPEFSGAIKPRRLTPQVVSLLLELSVFSPVAFVEAAYQSGAGEQIAVLWQAHKIILGPTATSWGHFGRAENKVRLGDMAINCALRRMGVRTETGKDEFDTVGLGRKRNTEAWC